MVNEAGGFTLERELRIAAAPETIWSFLTDPEMYVRWMGRSAELDPRPGGSYRVDVNGQDVARGEYRELEPHSRIVMSWGWEGEGHPIPPGSSTVEITLTPDGNETILRLVHRDLPSQEAADNHAEGWDHLLPRLGMAAAGDDPGPDPWH